MSRAATPAEARMVTREYRNTVFAVLIRGVYVKCRVSKAELPALS